MKNKIRYDVKSGRLNARVILTIEADNGDMIDERYVLLLRDFAEKIIYASRSYVTDTI